MRGVNNSAETVNAAAAAIVYAESRVQQVTVPRRRWMACLSEYWCFGSHKNGRRISNAVLAPEPALPTSVAPAPEDLNHSPVLRLPFVAPPSSPVSMIQSAPPSATQSPTGPLSFSTLSASSYSPTGPASIFAIGPYANETQLVSPPVFSTFTTEPSTAPFTPPPESVQLTTPSSPEVPFAQLLTSSLNTKCKQSETYELHPYQLYPGSPIGHLISPSSACSGTSSPFLDTEFHSPVAGSFLPLPAVELPKILSAEAIAVRKSIPRHARNGGSLLDGQISAAVSVENPANGSQSNEHITTDQRVSFELTAEEVARCLEKKAVILGEGHGTPEISVASIVGTEPMLEGYSNKEIRINETYHDLPEKSVLLPLSREFKFDNSDGAPAEPCVGSDWWANEKVVGTATEHQKRWAFFPLIQSGVS